MNTQTRMNDIAVRLAGLLPFEYVTDKQYVIVSEALREALKLQYSEIQFSEFKQLFTPLSARLLEESFSIPENQPHSLQLVLQNRQTLILNYAKEGTSLVGYIILHDSTHYSLNTPCCTKPRIEDYGELFRTLGQIVWVMSPDMSSLLYVSDAVIDTLGYTPDELYHNFDFLFGCIVAEDKDALAKVMSEIPNEGISNFMYRIFHKSGKIQWLKMDAWAEKNLVGETILLRGIMQDITDEKNNEKLIEIQRDTFRDLTINVPGVIYQWYEKSNGDYGFTFVSPKLKEIFDIESDEMNVVAERIHPDDKERWRESIEESKRNHTSWNFEGRLLYPDGSIKWWQGKSVIFRRNDEEIVYNGIMLDITEKVKNLEFVEQQQRKLESIRLGANIGTWELDIASGKTIWSDEVYAIHEVAFDFDHNAVNGIEFYHPDYRPFISEAIQKTINEGLPFDVVCMFITAKGNHRWVRSTGKRIGDKVIGSFQDITDIQERELKFEGIFNSIVSLLGFLNTDGILLEVNNTALTLGGIEKSDVIGKYFWDCYWWQISEQTRQELISQFKKAVAGEQVVYEVEIAIADNRTSTIIFSLRPIFDEQGKVLYIIPEGRPVDDVVEARDRFKSVLEGTNVGTWEWNIQTGETIFNERWAEIIGYTLEELSPISIETWLKFGHPEDLEKSGELLRQHFEGEKDYYECEARMKHKNGQWIWVLDRGKVSKWTADGKPLLMSGTHQDVTERKQYQSELISAKSAAEKANLAKSIFLSNMSHELRTPLNAILGFAQILLADKSLLPKHSEYIRTMYQSGVHLLRILNDILDISKIEAGKMILEHGDFSVYDVIRDIEGMFQLSCKQKKIQCKVNIQKDLPSRFFGDEKRLRQVLVNLIGNAVKFTEHGIVSLQLEFQQLDEQKYALHFSIKDTGKGIPKDQIPLITQPFYQIDALSNEGTGLGLSICTQILQMMNSSLLIESEEGIGSIFSFTVILQAMHSKVPTQDVYTVESHKFKDKYPQLPTIIIADDVESNRFFLTSLLKSKGYICYQAENGADAFAMFMTYKPKEILLDIVMPIMDGVECAKKIREYCANNDIAQPFITAVTAGIIGALPQEADNDYSVFDAVIHKPIDVKELWKLLQSNSIHYFGDFETSPIDEQTLTSSSPIDFTEFEMLLHSPYFSQTIAEAIEFQEFEDCIHFVEQLNIPDDLQEKALWLTIIDRAKNHDAFFFVKLSELLSV